MTFTFYSLKKAELLFPKIIFYKISHFEGAFKDFLKFIVHLFFFSVFLDFTESMEFSTNRFENLRHVTRPEG